ncbi:PH domain-containing protein [Microbacterium sp. NPDC090218]
MTEAKTPEGVRTFRTPSGPVVMVFCALLAVFLLGDAVIRGGWAQTLLLAPWVLLGLWIVYEISFVSHVRIDVNGVLVQNMLRRVSFGWDHVRDIDLRWQLQFALDDGTELNCYGGPAHSRPIRSKMRAEEDTKAPAGVRALTDIRDQWEASRGGSTAPIRRSWDAAALLALGVIVVWAVASVLIVNLG